MLTFLFGVLVGAVGLGVGSLWFYRRAQTIKRRGPTSRVFTAENVCAVVQRQPDGRAMTIRGIA